MAILANNSFELHQKKMGYQKLIEMLKLQYVSASPYSGNTGFSFLTAEVRS